jgi:hypothetical protein
MGSTGTAADKAPAKELTGAAKNQGDHKDVSIIFPPTFLCGESSHFVARVSVSLAEISLSHTLILSFTQERPLTSSRIQVRRHCLTANVAMMSVIVSTLPQTLNAVTAICRRREHKLGLV